MAIFFPPIPPIFTGGRQPYDQRELSPGTGAVPANDPPFRYGGPIALPAEIVSITQPNPWQYAFFGAWQPFQPSKINPDLLNRPGEDPPYTYGGPFALMLEILGINQPDPWQYKFMGGAQPFAPRRLSPSISAVQVDNPPFVLGGPVANPAVVIMLNQPDPWQYKYLGAAQPFAPKQNSPAIPGQSQDPPPFRNPGRLPSTAQILAQVQPDPWVYAFLGALQPYDYRCANPAQSAVAVNNPPFGMRDRQTVSLITAMNQPELWQYKFMGRFQPYEGAKLNPNILGASTGFYRGYIIF